VLRAEVSWPRKPADIAEAKQKAKQRQGDGHLRRSSEAKPGAVSHKDIADAHRLRPGGIERGAGGLVARRKMGDAVGEIVCGDRLEALCRLSR
jgi:hypothetical protein